MSAEGTVAYLRQSVTKEDARAQTLATLDAQVDQDLNRQRIAVDNWAKSKNLVLAHYYVDTNAKRSEAENIAKRPQFNQMLVDAKAKKFDTIVVSEQSRFGTADTHGFFAYIKTLRDLGITLIEARSNNDLTASSLTAIGPFLQSVIGSVASGMELQDKASQSLSGKIAKVSTHGQWMGGPIIFGCGVTNYAPDGTELWHQEVIGGQVSSGLSRWPVRLARQRLQRPREQRHQQARAFPHPRPNRGRSTDV